jgi:hypothetical protein
MNLTAVALSAIMAATLLFFGGTKLTGAKWTVDNFAVLYRLPQWTRLAVGAVEVISGALLLVGILFPIARVAAALLLGPAMLGAIVIEMTRSKMPVRVIAPTAILLGLIALLTLA